MVDRILMIDDDERLSAMVQQYLEPRGFSIDCRAAGVPGLEALRFGSYDGLILDVMLPDLDGFEILKRVRADSNLPVIMLTARGDSDDRIVGLEMGADDYLPKPFEPRELLARIRAILRRGKHVETGRTLRFGRLQIDTAAHSASVDDRRANLTSHQFALLLALAERAGRVLSRDQIMEIVRGDELEAFDRSIDVHISRIRSEIEDDPRKPARILTVRGVGYLFAQKQT
ncbi:MAG: two-component system phosphate regulon response regulator OmpR [Myxococcota bacterium]|jgi:two-component system phosphate regulon response regulator OmpR